MQAYSIRGAEAAELARDSEEARLQERQSMTMWHGRSIVSRNTTVAAVVVIVVGVIAAACATSGSLTGGAVEDGAKELQTEGRGSPMSVEGIVWADGDSDGVVDAGEGTVGDTVLMLWRELDGDGQCQTGTDHVVGEIQASADGTYRFVADDPGTYCVELASGAVPVGWDGPVSAPFEISAVDGAVLDVGMPTVDE